MFAAVVLICMMTTTQTGEHGVCPMRTVFSEPVHNRFECAEAIHAMADKLSPLERDGLVLRGVCVRLTQPEFSHPTTRGNRP